MSFHTCLIKAQSHLEKNGLEDQIPKERLYQLAKRLEAAGGDALTKAEFAAKMQAMILEDETRLRQKKQAASAMNLVKREDMFRALQENVAKWKDDVKAGQAGDPKKMAYEAARAIIQGGSLRAGEATNLDLDKMAHANEGVIRSTWNRTIEPIKDIVAKGVLDKATIQELWALDHKETLGQSGSPEALSYAKAIKATRDKIFSLKQASNPFLEAADEYLIKQSHNRERIMEDPSAAGKKAWVDMMERTFSDKSLMDMTPAEKRAQYEKTYEEIASGSYGSIKDGNIYKRQTQGRAYIAKDWQAFYEYNSTYGDGTLAETMDKSIARSSREIAQLDKWGPTPAATKDAFLERVEKSLSGDDKKDFQKNRSKLNEAFDVSMGSQQASAYGRVANFVKGALMAQYLSKTGGALIRSQPDVAISASLMRDLNGKTIFQNAVEIVTEYYKGLASSDYAQARMRDLSLFTDAANAELMRTMGSPDNAPGAGASLLKKIGALNLLNRHVNAMRAAMGTVLSAHLGDVAGTKFTDLSQRWQQGLTRYGITEPMWNAIRLGTENLNGRTLMTPEAVGRLPDVAVENFMRKSGQVTGTISPAQLEYGRHQMQVSLGTMLNEHADLGSAHPGTRQRTFLYGDTDINDGKGQILRMIAQFKTASLVQNDVYRRSYFSGETSKADWNGAIQHAITAAFFFTMGEMAKQLASGKTPEDPASPHFAKRMLVGSGAGGIFGDLILDETEGKTTRDKAYGVLKAAAGPVISTLAEGGAVVAKGLEAATGQAKKYPTKEAGNFVLNQIPGQNVFYTKALLNYYVTNGIREFLGPGYLHHLEQSVNKTPGLFGGHQSYFMGSPTH